MIRNILLAVVLISSSVAGALIYGRFQKEQGCTAAMQVMTGPQANAVCETVAGELAVRINLPFLGRVLLDLITGRPVVE